MKLSTIRLTALILFAAIISGCASGPQIITNSDPSVDFSQIQTFDFLQPLSTDDGNVRTLLSSSLISATATELEARGWRQVAQDPDVLIDFMFQTQEQIRTRNTSASVGMSRSRRYGTWGGTISTPTVEQTTQGAEPTRVALLRVLGRIAHAHEHHRVNSSTWYGTAPVVLGGFFDPAVAAIAVAIHGLADPAAAWIGRRWGRVALVNGRTLEGTSPAWRAPTWQFTYRDLKESGFRSCRASSL